MKRLISFVLAGVFGGLIALGGAYWLTPNKQVIATETPVQARSVNFAPGNNVPFDFTAAANVSMPVVVHIAASGKQKAQSNNDSYNPLRFFFGDEMFDQQVQGTGSGVIYSNDGYIVTNNHVVEFADKVRVTLYDNREFEATVVAKDKKTDLAVVKIEASDLPTLKLADSDAAKVGEWVLAVGNPFDLTSTVTAGIISAKGRSLRLIQDNDAIESFIQTDAAVNPGNSGGALIDAQGRLLGINTAIATRTGAFQGYSFAIPINLAKRIVDDMIKFGSYQRAFLGVNISELNNNEARELGLSVSQGVVIETLVDGGSAQYAGLQPKDVIVKVDGRSVKNVPELTEIVGRAKVGDVLNLTINRRGEEMDVAVRMKAG